MSKINVVPQASPVKIKLELPKNVKKSFEKIQQYKILVYGKPLAGKSYFADTFPDALFVNTDSNINWLSSPHIKLNSYEQLIPLLESLRKDTEYKTVVLDLVGDIYDLCRKEVLRKLGIEHEAESNYGQAWSQAMTLFLEYIREFTKLNKHIIYLSHSTDLKVDDDGYSRTMIAPELRLKIINKLAGYIDFLVFAEARKKHIDGKTHVEHLIVLQDQRNTLSGIRAPLKDINKELICKNNYTDFNKLVMDNIDTEVLSVKVEKKVEKKKKAELDLKKEVKKSKTKKEETKEKKESPKKPEKVIIEEDLKRDYVETPKEEKIIDKKDTVPAEFKNVKFVGNKTYKEAVKIAKEHGMSVNMLIVE